MTNEKSCIGNINLLKKEKTAFLTSRQTRSESMEIIKKWVEGLDKETDCIMCGWLTKVECEVLKLLTERKIPTIVVSSNEMPEMWPRHIVAAIGRGDLVAITVSEFNLPWEDKYQTAMERNALMMREAKKIVIGYCTPGGRIANQIAGRENVRVLS